MPTLKNKKHERFCREYLIDYNANQSAIRAGYSEKTARSQGQRLLTNVDIQKRIEELNVKVTDKIDLTVEKVLQDIEDLRQKAKEGNQFATSLKASELQGKHLKMFTDKMEVDADLSIHITEEVVDPSSED